MAESDSSAEHAKKGKVVYDDWLASSESENDSDTIKPKSIKKEVNFDKVFAEDKFSKREKKGHLLLQLQKTYKGDDRFKLDKDFVADDAKKLPANMIGSLSTREYELLMEKKRQPKKEGEQDQQFQTAPKEYDALDDGEFEWEHELETFNAEKSRTFSILA